MDVFQTVIIILYICILIAIVSIFVVIGTQVGSGDNISKVKNAINISYGVGGAMIVLLLCIHLIPVLLKKDIVNPEIIKTCMIYLTFFMSYMAFCISLINIKYI
jgi:hypothetical protein